MSILSYSSTSSIDSKNHQELIGLLSKVKDSDDTNAARNLENLAEYIEKEFEEYIKQDPDPLDERHPAKIVEGSHYGETLKVIVRDPGFLNHLLYISLDGIKSLEIHVAAARILLGIMPGVETNYLGLEHKSILELALKILINNEYGEPLHSYLFAILGYTTYDGQVYEDFRVQFSKAFRIALEYLSQLQKELENEKTKSISSDEQHNGTQDVDNNVNLSNCKDYNSLNKNEKETEPEPKRRRISLPCPSPAQVFNDCSNSSWAEMEQYQIGSCNYHPCTNQVKQRCIFWFLNNLVRSSDYLQDIYQYDLLKMLHYAINIDNHNDVRLALEALRTLAMLFYNRKCAFDFYQRFTLRPILDVYSKSVAANAVSNCLRMLVVHDDILQKICTSPKATINDIVKYVLSLAERSHPISRTIAVSFFQFVLRYRVFVEAFDQNDGLHKLTNQFSMIDISRFEWIPNPNSSNVEDSNYKRQYIRTILHTLKVYFNTHLVLKTQKILRSSIGTNCDSTLRSRLLDIDLADSQTTYDRANYNDLWMEHKNVFLELMPVKYSWEPVEQFFKLGGFRLLIEFLVKFLEETRDDSVSRYAYEILGVCSLMPKFQLFFAEKVEVPGDERPLPIMKVLLQSITYSSADRFRDREMFINPALLNLLVNCVCGPIKRPTIRDKNHESKSSKNDLSTSLVTTDSVKRKSLDEEILHKMWSLVRHSNGVMILIDLLTGRTIVKTNYADQIRSLACQALVGLSRCPNIRQIMVKLSIFSDGTLYSLMKAPVMHERQREHVQFSKSCFQLMKNVLGSEYKTDQNNDMETTLEDLKKAEIIANTKINFHERQLLQLVHKHFVQKGLHKTAMALLEEANIEPLIDNSKRDEFEFMSPMRKAKTAVTLNEDGTHNSAVNGTMTPKSLKLNRTRSVGNFVKGRSSTPLMNNGMNVNKSSENLFDKQPSTSAENEQISLDKIVKEYFRKQHSLCKNPVSLCPPFDLFTPHQCPVPKTNLLENNVTYRIQNREFDSYYHGTKATRMNRHYMYSRFRIDHHFRAFNERLNATIFCSRFANNYLYGGTDLGEIVLYDYRTSNIKVYHDLNVHGLISGLEVAGDLVVIQAPNDGAMCTLWRIKQSQENDPERLFDFDESINVKFSLNNPNHALGTYDSVCHLWDIEKRQILNTFSSEESNNYIYNVAVFHPDGNLILNDGVLWDVRTSNPVQKFDKFQEYYNGVFHPNGRQIVLGSEIWDLNTFRLLQSVPDLSDAHIVLNSTGDCVFALYQSNEDLNSAKPYSFVYQSAFRTFDGYDYSPIATVDVKKKIYDISLDPKCNYISLVESHKSFRRICTGYEIGRDPDDDDTDDDDDDDDDGGMDEEDEDQDRGPFGLGGSWDDSDDGLSNSDFSISEFSLQDSEVLEYGSNQDTDSDDEESDEDEEEDEEDEEYSIPLSDARLDGLDSDDDEDENTRYSLLE